MSDVTIRLKTAIGGFATFHNPDVQAATHLLLEVLNNDLDEAGYAPTDEALKALEILEDKLEVVIEEETVDEEERDDNISVDDEEDEVEDEDDEDEDEDNEEDEEDVFAEDDEEEVTPPVTEEPQAPALPTIKLMNQSQSD